MSLVILCASVKTYCEHQSSSSGLFMHVCLVILPVRRVEIDEAWAVVIFVHNLNVHLQDFFAPDDSAPTHGDDDAILVFVLPGSVTIFDDLSRGLKLIFKNFQKVRIVKYTYRERSLCAVALRR